MLILWQFDEKYLFYFHKDIENTAKICQIILLYLHQLLSLFLKLRRRTLFYVLFADIRRMHNGALSWLVHLMVEILLYRHPNCCKMQLLVYPIVTWLKLNTMLRLVMPEITEVVKDILKCKILVNVRQPLNGI